ncbi:MAG: hypothetical protein HY529_05725 [Chloroflexi bacterium]|nr:hypothetical protein [Chloroflexota bacterium]
MLAFSAACQQASAQDIQGLLQAIEGKEMVIKLDDGTIARITVQDNKAIAEAEHLVGKHVDATVHLEKGERQLEKIEKRAKVEDQKASGAIESINGGMARIGGRDFKITATTELDGGLVAGANARVEFITLPDGTMIATEIQTDKQVKIGHGGIDSIKDNKVVIGGQAFHMDDTTRHQGALAEGEAAHVEFVDNNGVKHITEIEPQKEDNHFTGTIQAMGTNTITVDGRTFKLNAATILDNGLAVGGPVRLEFITMADGQVVATEVETAQGEVEIQNENEQEHGPENEAGDDKGGGSGGGSGK